jgi:hypothetical protein
MSSIAYLCLHKFAIFAFTASLFKEPAWPGINDANANADKLKKTILKRK